MDKNALAQCTLEQYERDFAARHLIHGVVSYWAKRKPQAPAVIYHERRQTLDWITLEQTSADLARRLLAAGFRKGDFFVTWLTFSPEHILLEYACFRIGVIHVPLDLRLRPAEAARCVQLLKPRGFACLPTEAAEAVRAECAVPHFCTVTPGGQLFSEFAPAPAGELRLAEVQVAETDPAQVIFTTGSTGSPKPALLSHRNITCQNMCLGAAFQFEERIRFLVNLPHSHVGGQAEALMTTLFWGGTAVVLEVFDGAKSLAAIQEHKVHMVGQIPAMFNFEWRQPGYASFDLSSLETAIYGGQQVPVQFLERMAAMAPRIGTGLGLTECAGFCTYTMPGAGVAEIAGGLGFDMPVYPMSIRRPMRPDGLAGEELPDGEIGHVCFRGPQTFLGYIGDPEATARTISTDGHLYTGDLGFRDAKGLHLVARARWIIKPAGYQVFPGDVENHFCLLEKVAGCAAVGVEHRTLTEAIVAFIERRPDAEITAQELRQHARGIASYMRPLHYVILEPGQLPLNRAVKTDYVRLSKTAREEIERLRAAGRWDG